MWAELHPDERRRRVVVLALVTVLSLLLVLLLWQAARAVIALDRAGSTAPLLAAQVSTGDVDGSRASLERLQEQADQARSNSDGILWSVATWAPVVGDDLETVRVLAREIDTIATDALPAVVDVADEIALDTFTPRDGRIDLDAVERVAPVAARTSDVLAASNREVQAIDTDKVFGRLRVPLRDMQRTLGSATVAASAADTAGELLPTMLGGEDRRRYLLLIQNNAELRTLGGIPGSVAVIDADEGRLSMGRQGSAIDVRQVDEPVVELTEGERSVFPSTLGTDLRNTTFSPDFPRAAEIAGELTGDAFDTSFDGVVSVDPVTLAYLLGGLGSVTLEDDTELTADNAVNELLNGVYQRYADDLLAQDDVFADAARRIFDSFVAGEGDVQAILQGLVQAATDNRIMVWSADEQEQQRIATTGVAGEPPGGEQAPKVGVYLNDAVGSKMQYYLDVSHRLRSVQCLDDRTQRLELRTRLTSTAPREAEELPLSITGLNPDARIPRGNQRLNLRIAAPEGGRIERLSVDGEDQLVVGGDLDGRQVAIIPVELAPDSSANVAVTLRSGADQARRAVLTSTPGTVPSANDVRVASACD